jgi:hypothetical protein
MVYNINIIGFLDFAHSIDFKGPKNTMFWKLEFFPPSGDVMETPPLSGPLEIVNFIRIFYPT